MSGTIITDNSYVELYINENNTLNVSLVITTFFPIITSKTLDINKIILNGEYFIDISNILLNNNILPNSYIVNNDSEITITVDSCFLLNSIYIFDTHDGSSNFVLNPPVYTNVIPTVSSALYKDYKLTINGSNFLNTSSIILNNDSSINSFTIDSNNTLTIPDVTILKTYIITVSNSKFFVNGIQQNTIQLIRGKKYKFDQSSASNIGHPFRIATSQDGTQMVPLNNNNFTLPSFAEGQSGYNNSFPIPGWTVSGGGFGVSANGGPWTNPTLPAGLTQLLFCQLYNIGDSQTIYQSVTLSQGTYNLSFYYCARTNYYNNGFTLTASLGSNILVSNLVADVTKWQYFTTDCVIPSDGSYNVTFTFSTTAAGDLAYTIAGVNLKMYNNNTYSNGWDYTGTAGSDGAGIFIVPYDAPNNLYYKCANHANMGGSILIEEPLVKTYIITVTNSKFFIDGIQQNSIQLIRGQKYKFDQSAVSNNNHPFIIATSQDGTIYSNGWTYTGTAGSNGIGIFIVPYDAPNELYYKCENHSNMGGSIAIEEPLKNVSQIKVINEYNNFNTLTFNPALENILTPKLTSIDISLNAILINGDNLGSVVNLYLNNDVTTTQFAIINNSLIKINVSSIFQISKVEVKNIYDDSSILNISPPQYTNVLPVINSLEYLTNGIININGLNFINLKTIAINNDISLNFDSQSNSSIINSISIIDNEKCQITFSSVYQINKITVIDWYNNIVNFQLIAPSFPNIAPTISDASTSTVGQIILSGNNLKNITSIIINNTSLTPVYINSYTKNSNNLITIPVSTIFLVSNLLIRDSYNNSYTYSFNSPVYTNVLPIILSVENNGDFSLLITGENLININLLKLYDVSNNAYIVNPYSIDNSNNDTFIINDDFSITATISQFILLDKVDIKDGYNNIVLYDLNPNIITDIPPIIERISYTNNYYELNVIGKMFTNVNKITINNIYDFSNNLLTVKSDNLITLNTQNVILIQSIQIYNNLDNSGNFIVSPPIYTNLPFTISNCYVNSNSNVIISGINLLSVSQVLFNDASTNVYSFSIKNDTTIEVIPFSNFQLNKVTIINLNNKFADFNFQNGVYITQPIIITSVDNEDEGIIKVNGLNLNNITTVIINNSILSFNFTNEDDTQVIFSSEEKNLLNEQIKTITVINSSSKTASITNIPPPTVPICFPAGTPVNTDQGIIEINKIIPNIHTIRNKKIIAVSKTITYEDSIICIEKNALGVNIPSQTTYISEGHKIFYKKHMINAKTLVGMVKKVYKKTYKGEILYNILLETYDKMIVNNLIVETLDPNSFMGKFYTSNLTDEEKIQISLQTREFAKKYMAEKGIKNKKKHIKN